MASNNSAILDVITENKEISSIFKENKDYDRSSICSNSTIENSLAQSPSLESFSTIQDIENLSELNIDENSDLCVKIDNPQKHLETLETFITFRITTRVARIEFQENEYIVRRRYNDFIWLRQKLSESHPFCIIPPLPGKHSLIGQLDRYSKDFILLRMKALNVFIKRIVQHPILSCNEHFKIFLTFRQPDFTLYRRQRTNNNEVKIRTLNHSNSTHNVLKNRHLEFDKIKIYLSSLTEKLLTIEKISSRINKERSEYISELNTFYPVFQTWAIDEHNSELTNLLQNIANAVERNSLTQNNLIQSYNTVVTNPLKDFLNYVDVVQDTLRKRESFQLAYEHSLDELNKRHNEKDKLIAESQNEVRNSSLSLSSTTNNTTSNGSFLLWKQPSFDDKLEKLGVCIPQLLKKVESNQDNLECANESLRSDLDYWQIEKQQYLKKFLLNFVNKQIEYYQISVNSWEHVTNELTTPLTVCNNFKN